MNKNQKFRTQMWVLAVFIAVIFGAILIFHNVSKDNTDLASVPEFMPSEPGKALLVEFGDFQCPACGFYYTLVKKLKEEFGDRLEVVFKQFPLRAIHRNADLAARASEAARLQNKFLEMHNILFEKQSEWSNSDDALAIFTSYAENLGLERDKFIEDIDSDTVRDRINADYQEGVKNKVNSTPTFYLNGKKISPGSYDEFRQLIEHAIAVP